MIGKWNKSVILTYVGLGISVLGMALLLSGMEMKYTIVCFMFAGICDLFDGTVARRCKRTKEEKLFGIELDSLVDVISFVALPLVILATVSSRVCFVPIYILYAIFAVARLAHFNITAPTDNKPVKYYEGLPVTYAALIFPIAYLLSYYVKNNTFVIFYNLLALVVGTLFIVRIQVPKPRLVSSIILLIVAIIVTVLYLFVL